VSLEYLSARILAPDHVKSREYVASHPAGVMAMRLSASQIGKLNINIALSRTQFVLLQNSAINNGSGSVTLQANSGQASGAITFTTEARIINTGGTWILD
jgi:hypothetical protein